MKRLLLLSLLLGLTSCRKPTHDQAVVGGSGSTCAECHSGAYAAATFAHQTVGYGKECGECHLETTWQPQHDPKHDRFFPLRGAHAQRGCADCHAADRANPQPKACLGCHRAERDRVVEPDHSGFPTDCQECHAQSAWLPARLADHDQWWPLEGRHAATECASCHINGRYEGTPRDCIGCHRADRDRAEPDHAGFPTTCQDCHSVQAWRPAGFDHNRVFPLVGAHANTDCESCHVNGRYEGTPRDCIGCHRADRERAEPDHRGFPTACQSCHSQRAWRPAALDHDQFWPLEGAHADADCAGCHVNGRYEGTPRNCLDCHRAERDRSPTDHAGFSTTCTQCHSMQAWRPAAFDHDQFFRLEGAHRSIMCQDCHPNERYDGTPRDCIGCHRGDRDAARPTHVRLSDTCTNCHTQTAFRPATYTHQRFRVPHRGVSACASCHTNAADYSRVGCTTCHAHNQSSMDREHRNRRNYRYADDACLSCHPRGND